MSHKTIAVLGHFGGNQDLLNGQTVKTKNLVVGLEKHTDAEIYKIDTHAWTKEPVLLLKQIKTAFIKCDSVIMLPAHNGVRVFAPLMVHYKRKYRKKIFYDVIGGWLPEFLHQKPFLKNTLKHFDGIWTETSTMKQKLDKLGFENIIVVPNFKELKPLKANELIYPAGIPFRLCTFSRVMKEKGIGSAVQVIKKVNEQLGYIAYSLDIYGQIWEDSKEWFENIQQEFPGYISYKGCVDADKSVETLQDYFALLFPTHFYTEGIPGTIIDAYAAGIPVISAKWESYSDVIDEGRTGMGYEFDNLKALEGMLLKAAGRPQILLNMKKNCIVKSAEFQCERVVRVVLREELGKH